MILPEIELPEDTHKFVASMAALSTPFLAISYFALTWATNRMKDWEATKNTTKLGAPAQICWLAGGGILINCGFGTFLFGGLYISFANSSAWHQWIGVAAILFTFLLYLAILLPYIHWYYRRSIPLKTITTKDLKGLYNPHKVLRFDIWLFLVSCCVFMADMFCGNVECGVFGILYGVFATFGIGAYCGIIGDLLPRAQLG
mgnify:CR=1 FL=1